VAFVVALVGLRELAPGLRDQVMVSVDDKELVEARAATVQPNLANPWRQMVRLDIVAPALGIAIFLIVYYTAVGFFTIYLTSIFGFTTSTANGISTWYWTMDAIGLVVIGLLSDWLRVRKPFMTWIVSLLAVGLAIAYAPWMAAFTETIEKRNPALMATGLAVWGWLVRVTVCVSFFLLPYVVSSANTLVGAPAVTGALKAVPPGTPPPPALLAELGKIKDAVIAAPHQWQHWWWVCIAAQLLFIPFVLPMIGRWSPKAASADLAEHQRQVAELASTDS
jgi:hypothetical protein